MTVLDMVLVAFSVIQSIVLGVLWGDQSLIFKRLLDFDTSKSKINAKVEWMEGIVADRILKLDAAPQEEQSMLPKGELVEVVRHYKNPVFSDGWKEITEAVRKGWKIDIAAKERSRTIKEVGDFLAGVDPVLLAARIHLDKPCEETRIALDAALKNIGIMQSTRI